MLTSASECLQARIDSTAVVSAQLTNCQNIFLTSLQAELSILFYIESMLVIVL